MKHLFILSPIIWLVWCKHPYTVHDSSWEKPVAESLIDTICTAVHNYQWQMCCSRCSRAPEQNSVCSWTGKHTSQLCCWTSTCAHNRCTGNTGNLLGYRTWTVRLRQSDCKCKDYGLLPVHRPGTHGHYKDGCHMMRLLLQDHRCTKAKSQNQRLQSWYQKNFSLIWLWSQLWLKSIQFLYSISSWGHS